MVLKMAIYRFVGRIFYILHTFTYSLFQGGFRFPDVYSAVTLYTYYSVDDISIGTTGGSFYFVCVNAVLQRSGNENSKALRLLIEDIWTRKLKTLSLTAVTSSGIIDVYVLPSIARQYYHRI